jgi:hypothetical protein
LDHVKDTNKWELLIDEPSSHQKTDFENKSGCNSGTMVVWENVDRLLKNYSQNGGASAKKALSKIKEDLQQHLSAVYQRFLDPADTRARNIKMSLNGDPVLPWDPFCTGLSQEAGKETTKVELTDGRKTTFTMRAYILPRKEEFGTEKAAKAARISNSAQGIYVYRENRLIHGPDWLKMFSKEPHISLLRVEFSFDHTLDEAFQIDIKKSQIILNEALYDHVLDFLTPPRRAAEDVYRRGTKAKTTEVSKTAHDSSNRNISSKEGEISTPAIKSVDQKTGEAQITNNKGAVLLKLAIVTAAKPLEVHVQPVPSIDDGLLWEPCLIDGHCGVRLNTGHPYYSKVYVPNLSEGVTIQGIDALLWGVAVAELNCVSDSTKGTFADLRFEVSRNLRKLVQDLPDPETQE